MSINKIAIITSEFPPQPGGIGNHALNLARNLSEKGYAVEVICDIRSEDGNEEILFDRDQNFKIRRIQRQKIIFLTYMSRIYEAFKVFRKSDVVIVSGKFQIWIGAISAIFIQSKYLAVVHGSELLLPSYFFRKLTNFSLRSYDKIIAVSNFTKSLLKPSILSKTKVIYNGFQLDCNLDNTDTSNYGPVIITVGNVNFRKGQQNVLKALPQLLKKFPNLQYHIVGIPTEKENMEKIAEGLGVNHAVKFFGIVNEKEKCNLLKQADIFFMLSEQTENGDVEGFGIAILESNALGKPAIGARGSGIEEAINDMYSGILVDRKKPIEILRAVETILDDYENYSCNAKEWSNLFSWKKIIKHYIKIIEN